MCLEKTNGLSDIQIGWLAKSLAGHDRNQTYVIIDVKANDVLVADGRLKTVEKPKRKSRKHVQLIKVQAMDFIPEQKATFRNEDIKYALRMYQKQLTDE